MAFTDKSPEPTPTKGPEPTPGKAMEVGQHMIDKGAMVIQSLEPIKQISHHACSFNCNDAPSTIPMNQMLVFLEHKLWHSHVYEVKSGLWVNPRVPELIGKLKLENLAKLTANSGVRDRLTEGTCFLLVICTNDVSTLSPQAVSPGLVRAELVRERDAKYSISSESLKSSKGGDS
ncbi:oil body-associated protein 2A-like [Vigna radiata var. radiata]|uniref:Oil body-associated protein 2A-like n=1 Tax=Vigna radiata var. radiata TaxID=3916 RepID=A0A3Q0ESF3_VIGRR|nr:oil body-associated protein 2A-like [Vigna radiata var. radiata]